MPTLRQIVHQQREAGMLDLVADVLVIGGGPAASWAAFAATEAGARGVVVDKGYLGTSGATAPTNTGTWFAPPGPGVKPRWRSGCRRCGRRIGQGARRARDRFQDRAAEPHAHRALAHGDRHAQGADTPDLPDTQKFRCALAEADAVIYDYEAAMSESAEHPEAAAALVRCFASEEARELLAASGLN